MGKGIILRVPEGMELPAEVTSTLRELLPGYEKETYQKNTNDKESIERRINSLYETFLFILDSYPLNPNYTVINPKTLKTYAAECKAACDLKKDSIEELHLELEFFVAKLINILATCWQWPKDSKPYKEAIACLNDAECYKMMLSRGRKNIATLTAIEIEGQTEYALQYDKSRSPCYDLLLTELDVIKNTKFPKTPNWFRKLSVPQHEFQRDYQQAYFCNLKLGKVSPTEAMQDLNTFIDKWEKLKRESSNLTQELERIEKNTQPLPDWYNRLSVHHRELLKVLAKKPDSIRHELSEFKKQLIANASDLEYRKTLSLIPTIPQWYWNLPKRQQYFLEYVLNNCPTEEAFSFVSSRLRTMPLPSNFGAHSLRKINAKGEITVLFDERIRSSHAASRDELDAPDAVQQRHSDSNLAKVMEGAKPDAPRLMQTLISPIYLTDYLPGAVTSYLPEFPPDLELYKLARAAVERNEKRESIFQHNHPFNIAKYYYYTQAEDLDSKALLKYATQFVTKIPDLQELLNEYDNVLKSPMGSATIWDYDGRELFLSSLEQLIILTLDGYSYGSCVSGKDRKAIELLHTDAMILYKLKYGIWPKFGDPKEQNERLRFVNIFVDLYISRHQQELAGQNAPGSEGIKTPYMYLPPDIATAITKRLGKEKALIDDDRRATDNEVRNISSNKELKKRLLPDNILLSNLVARQLGEAMCTELYDALCPLVNQKKSFQVPSSYSVSFHKKPSTYTPTGIDLVMSVMQDERGGNNIERMAKIFSIILGRPEADGTRTKATVSVYERNRDFFKVESCNKKGGYEHLVTTAVAEWKQLFESSKTMDVLAY